MEMLCISSFGEFGKIKGISFQRVYKAKYNFQPIVGQSYFLYSREDGEFLSIISPTEWKNKYDYIGKYQLQSDGRWINLD